MDDLTQLLQDIPGMAPAELRRVAPLLAACLTAVQVELALMQQSPVRTEAAEQYLTAEEVAAVLGLSPDTVYRRGKRGDLPGRIELGGRVRFSRRAIEALAQQHEAW